MSSCTEWQLPIEVIITLCIYLPITDLIHVYNCIQNWRNVITTSELFCKNVILRDSYFIYPKLDSNNLCQFHLICNQNNALLIKNHWSQLVSPENVELINLLQTKTYQQYKTYQKEWSDLFMSTSTFKLLSRLMPFKYWIGQELINLFDISKDINSRPLTTFECKVFTPVHVNMINRTYKTSICSSNKLNHDLILDITAFKQLLADKYNFFNWYKFVNWKFFVISGSSIVSCFLNKDWTDQCNHDIDIYAYGIDIRTFLYLVNNTYTHLSGYANNWLNLDNIVSFEIQSSEYSIKLQFIFMCSQITPSKIIENFDLDICQLLFDVQTDRLLCTMAFVECIRSNYIIPYQLIVEDKFCSWKNLQRVIKYIKRGFNQLLLPSNMPLCKFTHKLNISTTFDSMPNSVNYYKSVIPCDYYNVQYHFFSQIAKSLDY